MLCYVMLRYVIIAAIHKEHGLVWTDGSSLYLHTHREERACLGEFEYVQMVVEVYDLLISS